MGTDGDDVICAGGGDDIITSLDGSDVVYTGPGADVIDPRGAGELVLPDLSGEDSIADEQSSKKIRAVDGTSLEGRRTVGTSTGQHLRDAGIATKSPAGVDLANAPAQPAPPDRSEHPSEDTSDRRRIETAQRLATELSGSDGYTGLYLDPASKKVVINIPNTHQSLKQDAERLGLPAQDLLFRIIEIDMQAVDELVTEPLDKIQHLVGQDNMNAAFDSKDLKYRVMVDDAKLSDRQRQEVTEIASSSDRIELIFSGVSLDAGDPNCDYDDCYAIMPGMKMRGVGAGNCSAGLVVNYGSSQIGMMSAAHCSATSFIMRDGGSANDEITLVDTGIRKYDNGTGSDSEIFAISETGGRGGEARLAAMNAVLDGPLDHSNLYSGTALAHNNLTICKTGYKSQHVSNIADVSCGVVTSMGDLEPGWFSSGYIEVDGMISCPGDSGGPVWVQAGTQRFAVGIVHGHTTASEFGVDVGGGKCGDVALVADIGRALSDTNSTFRDPSGTETTRRAAQRYYDILFDREPDWGGYHYYDQACSLTSMRDIAFVFTVTAKAEFANRFPLPAGNSSTAKVNARKRVEYLWWALQDFDASSNDKNYWGYDYGGGNSYIYGTHTSSSAAREARSDWIAWQLTVQPLWTFTAARMNWTGIKGAPAMCSYG